MSAGTIACSSVSDAKGSAILTKDSNIPNEPNSLGEYRYVIAGNETKAITWANAVPVNSVNKFFLTIKVTFRTKIICRYYIISPLTRIYRFKVRSYGNKSMCGIAGIISPQSQKVDRHKIEQMTDLMLHRGPDSSGVYSGEHFSFGHRRLSIIDLSEHGTQPMVWREKYVITYNGEIYNYLEIQKTLSEKGYHFETSTDTEVILAAYDFWGESCVDQFNGMWAFAIYDRSKHKIFASRDRFGIKPFYYSVINGEFVFASEIKPILSHMDNIKANKSIIADYLTLGYEDHTNQTF